MTWMLIAVIVVALAFDFVNGRGDAADAIATVVSTRVLPPFVAIFYAALITPVPVFPADCRAAARQTPI
jgi:PiT family inorganic phosphate transporter